MSNLKNRFNLTVMGIVTIVGIVAVFFGFFSIDNSFALSQENLVGQAVSYSALYSCQRTESNIEALNQKYQKQCTSKKVSSEKSCKNYKSQIELLAKQYNRTCMQFGKINCADSDGGTDRFIAGTMKQYETDEGQRDVCMDSNRLKEFYCSGRKGVSKVYNCENGCREGACAAGQRAKPYKIGFIYVYHNTDTYNPNWRANVVGFTSKLRNALISATDGKIAPEITIIGELETNRYIWNPAFPGLEITSRSTKIEEPDTAQQRIIYDGVTTRKDRTLVSQFDVTGIILGGEFIKIYTDASSGKTIKEIEQTRPEDIRFIYPCSSCSIGVIDYTERDKQASPELGIQKSTQLLLIFDTGSKLIPNWDAIPLREEATQKISGFNLANYDKVFYIFGKLGAIIPNSRENIEYRCTHLEGIIAAYSSGVVAENSLLEGGIVDCMSLGTGVRNFYLRNPNWQIILHEILHKFGACDVYETGPVFGIQTCREEAARLDTRVDESVLGNGYKPCMEDFTCTARQLDEVYVDIYNKRRIKDYWGSVTVLYPNGGETWNVGDTIQIKWDGSEYPATARVEIMLKGIDQFNKATIAETTNSGSYTFTIPNSMSRLIGGKWSGGRDYAVEVQLSTENIYMPHVNDKSDSMFTIMPPPSVTFTLNSPSAGTYAINTQLSIEWASSNYPQSEGVEVAVYREMSGAALPQKLFPLAPSMPNDGAEEWIIWDWIEPGDNYKIGVTCLVGSPYNCNTGFSQPFTIIR